MGQYLGRPRPGAAHALTFELSGDRDRRLWLDAGRATAGLYVLTRDQARQLEAIAAEPIAGATQQGVLLLRKHVTGARISGLRRIEGERMLVLELGRGIVALRLSGPAPAITLVVDGTPLATLGTGPAAWPLPTADPGRDWDRIAPETLRAAASGARETGSPVHRAIAAACPALGPLLARELDGSDASLMALRSRLRSARPTLLAPGPLEACDDAELVAPAAVVLVPLALPGWAAALQPGSWREAAASCLLARYRGQGFAARRRTALAAARRETRRLTQLEANLSEDQAGLPDPSLLRRRAEALLASAHPIGPGAAEADVPDPRDPETRLRFPVDPRLGGPKNADRLFEKARRIERARLQIHDRVERTRAALAVAQRREAAASSARSLEQVEAPPEAARERAPAGERSGPRRYLTARGLTILVGRGARENHHLTFAVARPEDLWLHARDVPGAHVILRDDQGRAGPEDIREAAEVAAFFSDARQEARADVHVTRRKHLHSAGTGAGRVRIAHSDTVRVAPRDPEGRLRKR